MADKSPGKESSKARTVHQGTPGCQARQGRRVDTDCAEAQALTR